MVKTNLYFDEIDTLIGPLLVVADGEKAIRIDFGTMTELEDKLSKWANRYFINPVFTRQSNKITHIKEELQEYFKGKRYTFSFTFQLYGTTYQKKVWQALFTGIAFGETKTYKDIAIAIDNPKSVRAVGGAVNKNPFSIVVPCHRVIGTNGKMVGYNGGIDKKEFLLKHENDNTM